MSTVQKVLIPVAGGAGSLAAAQALVQQQATARLERGQRVQVVLVNVQPPLRQHASRFIDRKTRQGWREQKLHEATAHVQALLRREQIEVQSLALVGERAACIVQAAQQLNCQKILVGARRAGSLLSRLSPSLASRLLSQTTVPVEVVPFGGQASALNRRLPQPASVAGI